MADDALSIAKRLGLDSEKIFTHAFFPEVNIIDGAKCDEMRLNEDGTWTLVILCRDLAVVDELRDRFQRAGGGHIEYWVPDEWTED